MNKFQLITDHDPIPVEELSQYLHWPCTHVKWVRCRQVMTRRHRYLDYSDIRVKMGMKPAPRVPFKGGRNTGTPLEFEVHTPKDVFFIYRHWDWYWEMSWFMDNETGKDFIPPKLRDRWVRELITNAKRLGVYWPHKDEVPLPVWNTSRHVLTDPDTPFFGAHGDIRMPQWQRMTDAHLLMVDNWKTKWLGPQNDWFGGKKPCR